MKYICYRGTTPTELNLNIHASADHGDFSSDLFSRTKHACLFENINYYYNII